MLSLKILRKSFLFSLLFPIFFSSLNIANAQNLDVNNDGIINQQDLTKLSNFLGSDEKAYDLNKDGIIDAVDIAILAKEISDDENEEQVLKVFSNDRELKSFTKSNLINAITLAHQNKGIVKLYDDIIWCNNDYHIYSKNNLNNRSNNLREAYKIAKNSENSIVVSKNGNVIYSRNLNYRKIMGVTRASVNLRSEPNISSRTDITIPDGTLLEVNSIVKGFYNVSYYDNLNNLHVGFIPNYIDIIQDDIHNSQLGYISAREESNGNPGAVGLNPNDKGGASFGIWQLSSKMGSVDDFLEFIKPLNKDIYSSLMEAKKEDNNTYNKTFIKTWKDVANKHYDSFYDLQRSFIKKNYYDSFITLAEKNNLNVNYLLDFNSISNMIWSTSVQHGPTGAIKIFKEIPLATHIESIIAKVYDKRLEIISKSYPPNSTNPGIVSLYNGIKNRLESEKNEILRIYQREISY